MSNANSFRVEEGRPFPQGATWTGLGVNFALFSAHATKVELCIFDDTGGTEIGRVTLPEYTNEIWHGFLPEARPGTVYGYRVHGPYEPENGHRFNPNKLVMDPYAKGVVGQITWAPELFGYVMGEEDTTFDERDSAPFMPKCRVIDPAFTWGDDRSPRVPWERTVMYETHVKGFTKLHPAVPEELRGTFRGLATPEVVSYIKNLGVTSVELLPIHMFADDSYLVDKGLVNYWGYSTLAFFAPSRRYASVPDFAFSEFKEMVSRFHAAGIEVILDVVYNHTCEGNEKGPTLSFKGVDNASYYRLLPDQKRYYINDTGTGNTLNLSNARVIQMVMDSLRYWVTEMHVDGFRFDLGTILARETYGFDQESGFLRAVGQDPVLSQVKMIAEPWDCGPGGYQVGGFPPGWAEWNDRYRDNMRAFWKGDEGKIKDFATRFTGSSDFFNHRGRPTWSSVNFLTAHDGFTLNDWASYNEKHNEANGEDNNDGNSNNESWNCGVEGATDDPLINGLRERQIKNMLATLLLSRGTPMMLAGDEFGRTQGGNNNAYCQDNEISWLNWNLDDKGRSLVRFVASVNALRRRLPILHRSRFLTAEWNEELGIKDVTWVKPTGEEMDQGAWDDANTRCIGVLLDGRAQVSGIRRRGADATVLVIVNSYHDGVPFKLPAVPGGLAWVCLIDTNQEGDPESTRFEFETEYVVTGRSLLMFELVLDKEYAEARGVAPAPRPAVDIEATGVVEKPE
jgi:isoamylase